jgi:Skp family chaperone for outer membrane proteins
MRRFLQSPLSRYRVFGLCGVMFALSLMIGVSATPVQAQDLVPARIAVIDISLVERESVAWQNLREQFETVLSGYQAKLRARQTALEEEGRQLEQQRSILSSDAFQEKKRAFDQQVAGLQRTAQQGKQELDKAYAAARNQIRAVLRDVVLEIAKDRELNLIFGNSPQERTVVMAHEGLSISDEALERLNKKIQTVNLPDVAMPD